MMILKNLLLIKIIMLRIAIKSDDLWKAVKKDLKVKMEDRRVKLAKSQFGTLQYRYHVATCGEQA